jgi:hypothetical protein
VLFMVCSARGDELLCHLGQHRGCTLWFRDLWTLESIMKQIKGIWDLNFLISFTFTCHTCVYTIVWTSTLECLVDICVFELGQKLCTTGIWTHIFQMHHLQYCMLLLLCGWIITDANVHMQELGCAGGKDLNLPISSTTWR